MAGALCFWERAAPELGEDEDVFPDEEDFSFYYRGYRGGYRQTIGSTRFEEEQSEVTDSEEVIDNDDRDSIISDPEEEITNRDIAIYHTDDEDDFTDVNDADTLSVTSSFGDSDADESYRREEIVRDNEDPEEYEIRGYYGNVDPDDRYETYQSEDEFCEENSQEDINDEEYEEGDDYDIDYEYESDPEPRDGRNDIERPYPIHGQRETVEYEDSWTGGYTRDTFNREEFFREIERREAEEIAEMRRNKEKKTQVNSVNMRSNERVPYIASAEKQIAELRERMRELMKLKEGEPKMADLMSRAKMALGELEEEPKMADLTSRDKMAATKMADCVKMADTRLRSNVAAEKTAGDYLYSDLGTPSEEMEIVNEVLKDILRNGEKRIYQKNIVRVILIDGDPILELSPRIPKGKVGSDREEKRINTDSEIRNREELRGILPANPEERIHPVVQLSEHREERKDLIIGSKKIILTEGDRVNSALNQSPKIKEEVVDRNFSEISKEIIDIRASSGSVKVESNRKRKKVITTPADAASTNLAVKKDASHRNVSVGPNGSKNRYNVQISDISVDINGRDELRVIPSGRPGGTGACAVRSWAAGEGIRRIEDWPFTGGVASLVERRMSKGIDDIAVEMERSEEQDREIERRQEAVWEKLTNFRRRQLMKDRKELRMRALEEYVDRLPDVRALTDQEEAEEELAIQRSKDELATCEMVREHRRIEFKDLEIREPGTERKVALVNVMANWFRYNPHLEAEPYEIVLRFEDDSVSIYPTVCKCQRRDEDHMKAAPTAVDDMSQPSGSGISMKTAKGEDSFPSGEENESDLRGEDSENRPEYLNKIASESTLKSQSDEISGCDDYSIDGTNQSDTISRDAKKDNSVDTNNIGAHKRNFRGETSNNPSEINSDVANIRSEKASALNGRHGSNKLNDLNDELLKAQVRDKIQPRNDKGRFTSRKKNNITGETKIKTKEQMTAASPSSSENESNKENSGGWIQLTEDLVGLQPGLTGRTPTPGVSGRKAAIEARKRTQMLLERENDEARVYKKRNKNETAASPL